MGLKQHTEELKKLLDLFSQPVFLSEAARVVWCNHAAAALGVSAGDSFPELLRNEPVAGERSPACLTLTAGGKSYEAVLYVLEGSLLTVLNTLPVFPEHSLQLASQSLRAPLTNLFASASSLFPILEELEDPSLQRQLSEMNRSFYQLLRLSGNLSDLGRLLSGETEMNPVRTDLSEYLALLLERVAPLCRAAGTGLEWELPPGSFYAWIDRIWLERALLNLFSNALKFTPKGGRIRFSAERSEAFVTFRISDSGEGMDGEALGSAFSRATREGGTGDSRWGVGLGLPIAQEVARRHGGALLLQVRQDGTDAVFSVSAKKPDGEPTLVKSPAAEFDYTGGFRHELVELSDVLPPEVYDTRNIN